jgi:hypothetical protein
MHESEIAKLINSSQVCKFSSFGLAQEFAYRTQKPHLILHGDDGKFWVTTLRVASLLESAGYEMGVFQMS